MRLIVVCLCLLTAFNGITQSTDSLQKKYFAELRAVGRTFSNEFYPNRNKYYALPEKVFVDKIDSSRKLFNNILNNYSAADKSAPPGFVKTQQDEIHYFFDALILDYPYFHEIATGKKTKLSAVIQKRMDENLADFNDPDMLSNSDFINYVEAFLHERSNVELKKARYKRMDNQRLHSVLAILPIYFTNPVCRNFWQYRRLNEHLEDWGAKNMDRIIASFNASGPDTSYTNKINAAYATAMRDRAGHLIKTYKSPGGFDLDMHLFLPDSLKYKAKRPVIVYFSGGSWTKGNPEWAFAGCENYAKNGWVAVSVEYRLADRQGTTPFEAVKDARSAIRWLRQHADEYSIDTNRIVAAGNSAGGHLVLAAALADKWNEKTDDLRYGSSPNLLMISGGVYDFQTDENTTWISKPLKNKNTVREISPVHLVRKGLPPMLLIHGADDRSVPCDGAIRFDSLMKQLGNDTELHVIKGGPHEVWYDRRFSGTVSALRTEFLKKHGYE